MTNKDIVFGSLMGIDNVKTAERIALVQDEMQKHVLFKIPFLPFKKINRADAPRDNDVQYFPLQFSFTENGTKWLFPYEPMINISSGNTIIKRNVAKQGNGLIGTVKERWARKDFDITVTGVLLGSIMSGSVSMCYPKTQMQKLFDFLVHNKAFYVYSEPLQLLGINKVVVEDYSFPFTKGENVQAYELKLVSDHSYELLVEDKPLSNV